MSKPLPHVEDLFEAVARYNLATRRLHLMSPTYKKDFEKAKQQFKVRMEQLGIQLDYGERE